jgi:predicted secreted hydrolase
MKSKIAILFAAALLSHALDAQYRTAVPGYRFEFPRDYFDHPDFQTEWWYYTGNLKSSNGHRLGFELTFFREAVSRDAVPSTDWTLSDLYLAHLALSDLQGGKFYHSERVNRAGPGIAGVSASAARIWNGNWRIAWQDSVQELEAIDARFQISLKLRSQKPPVLHGDDGLSQKSTGTGQASYYFSLTHLDAVGEVVLNGERFSVSGLAWMDHEFFTQQLQPDQVGWDWLSIQLSDNTELMLFHLRRKDGSVDPYSAGTYVNGSGKSTHLRNEDFTLQPARDTWTSPVTHGSYPIAWKIAVPKLGLELDARTALPNQELASGSSLSPSYWEGAISLVGRRTSSSERVTGVGYLEMTGYAGAVKFAP